MFSILFAEVLLSPLSSVHDLTVGSLSNGDSNENGKKALGLDWQDNNFARASRFFVHFLAVVARLPREYAYFHVSSRTGTQDNNFLKLPSNIRRRILNKKSCDDRQRFFFLLSAQANYKGKEVSAIRESLLLSLKFIKNNISRMHAAN